LPKALKKSMLNWDMRMFSGRAKSRRQPPVATGVAAFA
jgi:hypothetical protein